MIFYSNNTILVFTRYKNKNETNPLQPILQVISVWSTGIYQVKLNSEFSSIFNSSKISSLIELKSLLIHVYTIHRTVGL